MLCVRILTELALTLSQPSSMPESVAYKDLNSIKVARNRFKTSRKLSLITIILNQCPFTSK